MPAVVLNGGLAQWESIRFTREGSLVQSQYPPPLFSLAWVVGLSGDRKLSAAIVAPDALPRFLIEKPAAQEIRRRDVRKR